MSSYRVEADIHVTFRDGQILVPLNGQQIDLMKLDSVAEVHTVMWSMASRELEKQMVAGRPAVSSTVPMPPQEGPDLSGYAEEIRKSFQGQADKAQERLHELTIPAASNENPA